MEAAMTGDTFKLSRLPRRELADRAEWALLGAVQSMHSVGADTEYEMQLSVLRDDVRMAVGAAQRTIQTASSDPMLRWSVVSAIAATGHPEVIAFLHDSAVREIGERDPKGGCEQRIDAEILVQIAAVEGLVGLLSIDPETVTEVLLNIITLQRQRPVRESAARGLVAARPATRGIVEEALGDDRYWLNLKSAVADDLTVNPDLNNPRRETTRRLAGPKPLSCDHAKRRQRPPVDGPCGDDEKGDEHE
jgi:hypothetical protein